MGRQKSATSHTTVAEAPQKEAKLAWKLESENIVGHMQNYEKEEKKLSVLNVTPTKRQPLSEPWHWTPVQIREMTIDRKIRT